MIGYTGGYTPNFKVYKNTNSTVNNHPSVPTGMNAVNSGGYWRFLWNSSSDDHTPKNMMQYKIVIGTYKKGTYDYIS